MLLHIFVLYHLLRIYKLHKIIKINDNIYLYIKKKKKIVITNLRKT